MTTYAPSGHYVSQRPIDKIRPYLRRGGRLSLPSKIKGAGKETNALLFEANTLGDRVDAARVAQQTAFGERNAYPQLRAAELADAARSGEAEPIDRTTELEAAVKATAETFEATKTAQIRLATELLPMLVADAPKIADARRDEVAAAEAEALGHIERAQESLAAANDARSVISWCSNISAEIRAVRPSPAADALTAAAEYLTTG